jgi:hypothetical protein
MPSVVEPCPFCSQPITREYGSFRCKHCAKSSEDLLDAERKARAADRRKAARAAGAPKTRGTGTPADKSAEKSKIVALAIARHIARKKQLVPVAAGSRRHA